MWLTIGGSSRLLPRAGFRRLRAHRRVDHRQLLFHSEENDAASVIVKRIAGQKVLFSDRGQLGRVLEDPAESRPIGLVASNTKEHTADLHGLGHRLLPADL